MHDVCGLHARLRRLVSAQITVTDNAGNVTGTTQLIDLTGTGVTAATAVTLYPNSLSFANTVVGQISPPQSVTITNTGSETLDITGITTGSSNNFAWTSPSCLAVDNTLEHWTELHGQCDLYPHRQQHGSSRPGSQ